MEASASLTLASSLSKRVAEASPSARVTSRGSLPWLITPSSLASLSSWAKACLHRPTAACQGSTPSSQSVRVGTLEPKAVGPRTSSHSPTGSISSAAVVNRRSKWSQTLWVSNSSGPVHRRPTLLVEAQLQTRQLSAGTLITSRWPSSRSSSTSMRC